MIRMTVQYDKNIDRWQVIRGKHDGMDASILSQHLDQDDAIVRARREARRLHESTGETVELVIKTREGKIRKGSSGRSTYGKDPRRSKN